MLKRIITAFVCLTIFTPVLIFSGTPVGKIVFISLLTALAVVGVYELAGCIGVRRQWLLSIPSYIFVILMMIFVLFLPDKSDDKNGVCNGVSLYIRYFFRFNAFKRKRENVADGGACFGFGVYRHRLPLHNTYKICDFL